MMATWENLSEAQKRTLARMASLAGEGRYYMPRGSAWKTIKSLVTKGLANFAQTDGWDEDTGYRGPVYNLTLHGAQVAAQEPGHDRCHLPLPVPT